MASSVGDRDGIWAQNGAKRPFTGKYGAFVGAFGVLYVLAVVRLPLWGLKRGFLARFGVWGVCLGVFVAFRGF